MGKQKALVSDEEIVASIMSSKTMTEAANKCGLSTQTIGVRMRAKEFQAMYKQAKTEVLRETVYVLNRSMVKAVETVAEIMEDPENNAAVRLQAAEYIIKHSGDLADKLSDQEWKALPPDPEWEDLFKNAF